MIISFYDVQQILGETRYVVEHKKSCAISILCHNLSNPGEGGGEDNIGTASQLMATCFVTGIFLVKWPLLT